MGPRAGLSTVLLLGSFVLLLAIAVGNGMGSRVLGLIPGRVPTLSSTPYSPPSIAPTDAGNPVSWKHVQVVSVATDPGFPDPRVTPEPEATSRPRPATPKPKPTPTPEPVRTNANSTYTSPPLPLPIVSHSLDETPQPDPEATVSGDKPASPAPPTRPPNGKPGAGATLPPVSPPTISP